MKRNINYCKGCNKSLPMDINRRALSRYKHGELCGRCGEREALQGDFIKLNRELLAERI